MAWGRLESKGTDLGLASSTVTARDDVKTRQRTAPCRWSQCVTLGYIHQGHWLI